MKKNNQKKSNLDERQEQILLHIERNACWLVFWGLLAALVVQQFSFGIEFKYIAGEWIVFMIQALYIVAACMKNGIWDRNLKPDAKTNIRVSLIAAAVSGIISAALSMKRYPGHPVGSTAAGLFTAMLVFTVTVLILQISAKSMLKRQAKIDAEPEEQEEI